MVELSVQFDVVLDPIRVAQRQKALYRELERDVKPIHSVAAFARRVSQVAPVAVASGSDQPHVESTLRAIGMSDVFSIIITPADVAHGKPHPDMFLLAAARMTVDPARCLVIEDAEFGFEAARRAGMQYAKVLPPLEDTRYS